jgi:hypothetical protein
MRTGDLARLLEGVTLTSPKREQTMARHFTDNLLDRCEAAYRAEHERWAWRRRPDGVSFELIRNTNPAGGAPHREDDIVTTRLTKRECPTSDDAKSWLNVYRGRASMAAVLGVLAERTMNSAAQRKARLDPLRNNPIVGFMSEEQAEGILAEMRAERCR